MEEPTIISQDTGSEGMGLEATPSSLSYIAYFDGVCLRNPGDCGIGYVIFDANKKIICEESRSIGYGTNNEAEYQALIALLDNLIDLKIDDVEIFGDSHLIINQVNGSWNINWRLYNFAQSAWSRLDRISKWDLKWVPREDNSYAARLSLKAIKGKGKQPKNVFTGKIDKFDDEHFLAHGTKDYMVDLINEACTCPAFINYATRPCKHLVAVRKMVSILSL